MTRSKDAEFISTPIAPPPPPSPPTPLSTAAILYNGTLPAPADNTAPFLQIPWIAQQLQSPQTTCIVPGCRLEKSTGEDSLMAEILKTPRTIRHCICFHPTTPSPTEDVTEVSSAMIVGDGMNGHPAIMHGGIVATLCDEAMGIYMSVNVERHRRRLDIKKRHEEEQIMTAFTAELKITYKAPVAAPAAVVVVAKRVRKEGRKEWLRAEVLQEVEGKIVLCAVGEALFVEPKKGRTKPTAKM